MSRDLFCRFAHGLLPAARDIQKLFTSIENGSRIPRSITAGIVPHTAYSGPNRVLAAAPLIA